MAGAVAGAVAGTNQTGEHNGSSWQSGEQARMSFAREMMANAGQAPFNSLSVMMAYAATPEIQQQLCQIGMAQLGL